MSHPITDELIEQLKQVTLAVLAATRDGDLTLEYRAKLLVDGLTRELATDFGLTVEIDVSNVTAEEIPSAQEARAGVLRAQVAFTQRMHARLDREAAEREQANCRRRAHVAIHRARARGVHAGPGRFTARTGARSRGAGRPRARRTASRSAAASSGEPSDSDGPGEKPRQVVLLGGSDRRLADSAARIGTISEATGWRSAGQIVGDLVESLEVVADREAVAA
jgi:hypothetical protein